MPQQVYGATVSILVVERDDAVAELIRIILNQVPGWGATVVRDAAAAREVYRYIKVEALVVDASLPGISGLELLKLLRQDPDWSALPVLLLADGDDRSDLSEAVQGGLITGFVRKPFDVDALVREMRMAVESRRPDTATPGDRMQVIGALSIDRTRCSVAVGGAAVKLTPTEYRLLCELAEHPDQVVSAHELAERVWGYDDAGIRRSLGVHLRRLRAKLSAGPVRAPTPSPVRGLGYWLSAQVSDGRTDARDVEPR